MSLINELLWYFKPLWLNNSIANTGKYRENHGHRWSCGPIENPQSAPTSELAEVTARVGAPGSNGATEVPDHPQENQLGVLRQRCPTCSCPTTHRHCTALDSLYSITQTHHPIRSLRLPPPPPPRVIPCPPLDITWTPQSSRACGHYLPYKTLFP